MTEERMIGIHRVWLLRVKRLYRNYEILIRQNPVTQQYLEFAHPRGNHELIYGIWLVYGEEIVRMDVFNPAKTPEQLGETGVIFKALAANILLDIPKSK